MNFLRKYRILRGHANRTGIEMADAHHNAAHRYQGGRGKTKLLRPQEGGNHDVAAGL